MRFVISGMKGLVPQSLLPVVVLVISLGACTANKESSKVETTLANMAKDVVIPIEAEKKKKTLPVNEDTLREARSICLQSFESCAIMETTGTAGRTLDAACIRLPWT
jgi:hypothetical protein